VLCSQGSVIRKLSSFHEACPRDCPAPAPGPDFQSVWRETSAAGQVKYGPFILGDLVPGALRVVQPGKVKAFLDYIAEWCVAVWSLPWRCEDVAASETSGSRATAG
jgi:hypothetical protein